MKYTFPVHFWKFIVFTEAIQKEHLTPFSESEILIRMP